MGPCVPGRHPSTGAPEAARRARAQKCCCFRRCGFSSWSESWVSPSSFPRINSFLYMLCTSIYQALCWALREREELDTRPAIKQPVVAVGAGLEGGSLEAGVHFSKGSEKASSTRGRLHPTCTMCSRVCRQGQFPGGEPSGQGADWAKTQSCKRQDQDAAGGGTDRDPARPHVPC